MTSSDPPATPVWFGHEERCLFGLWHVPAGAGARGVVVICPPLGPEGFRAHAVIRLAAEQLTGLGLCVLRFDYEGAGDSAGSGPGAGRVGTWPRSLSAAVDFSLRHGPGPVTVLALRSGALAAASLPAGDHGVENLVLWDPVPSGRAFVHEQQALRSLAFEGSRSPLAETGDVAGPALDPATISELASLSVAGGLASSARHILIMVRPDQNLRGLAASLAAHPVDWEHTADRRGLLDLGCRPRLPKRDLARVASWVTDHVPPTRRSIRTPPVSRRAVVGHDGTGADIVETATRLGRRGWLGIISAGREQAAGPIAVLLSGAPTPGVAAGRLWVELARGVAAEGHRCARVDLSEAAAGPPPRPPSTHEELIDVCAALSSDVASDLVLVGMSTSAHRALESAGRIRPRGLVAIHPRFGTRLDGAPAERLPARTLRELAQRGVLVALVCGEQEAQSLRQRTGRRALDRLGQTGLFRLEVIRASPSSDQRELVARLLSGLLSEGHGSLVHST